MAKPNEQLGLVLEAGDFGKYSGLKMHVSKSEILKLRIHYNKPSEITLPAFSVHFYLQHNTRLKN